MNETLTLLLAWMAGGALGIFFFGGLWWTVRRGASSPRPALWFTTSMLLRMSIALAGFYFIGRGQWERVLVCLLGFITARLVVLWLTRPSRDQNSTAQEARHAP